MAGSFEISIHPDRLDPTKPNFIGGTGQVPLSVRQESVPAYPTPSLVVTSATPVVVSQDDVIDGRWQPNMLGVITDFVDKKILRVYDGAAFLTAIQVRDLFL